MQMDIKQAKLNQQFTEELAKAFKVNCENLGIEPTNENFSRFILEINLVTETQVNRYMCYRLFPILLYKFNGVKVRAVHELEDILCLKERHIWSLTNSTYHRFKKRVINFLK